MTDKQTIIDGCDVSGCSFFDIHYLEDEDVEIKNFCRIVHCDCDSYPNCYYKQLKRKEQECEELYNQKMKLIDKSIEQKCKIRELIDENATKKVIYKVNGKCAKTVANKVEEIRKIVEGKDCKYSKYKQALNEIEKIAKKDCKKCCEGTAEDNIKNSCSIYEIKDIINKAKDGE